MKTIFLTLFCFFFCSLGYSQNVIYNSSIVYHYAHQNSANFYYYNSCVVPVATFVPAVTTVHTIQNVVSHTPAYNVQPVIVVPLYLSHPVNVPVLIPANDCWLRKSLLWNRGNY